jgi:hypothetical protein
MPTQTYDLISTTSIGTAASTVTISSIPSTYRDLVFVVDGLTTGVGPYNVGITTNLNTGNYFYVYVNGNGSTTASSGPGDNRIQVPGRGSYWSNGYRTYVVGNIFDYTQSNKHKPFIIRTGTGTQVTELLAAREPSTGTISSISFAIGGAASTFAVGSVFTIYGIVA